MNDRQLEDWLAGRAKGADRRVVTCTPEMAEEVLQERMPENQRLCRTNLAEFYAGSMREGRWRPDVADVLFSRQGLLLDGQHRLAGISIAGVPVALTVRRNVDEEVMTLLDSGRKRYLADHLRIAGVDSPGRAATLANFARAWDSAKAADRWPLAGGMFKDACRPDQAIAFLESRKHARGAIAAANNKVARGFFKESDAMLMHLVLFELNPGRAAEFFRLLFEGGTTAGHPIHTLQIRLLTERKTRLRRFDRVYLVCNAWNAWIRGQERKGYKLAPESVKGKSFPWPITPEEG
jgi:hypothetical protein